MRARGRCRCRCGCITRVCCTHTARNAGRAAGCSRAFERALALLQPLPPLPLPPPPPRTQQVSDRLLLPPPSPTQAQPSVLPSGILSRPCAAMALLPARPSPVAVLARSRLVQLRAEAARRCWRGVRAVRRACRRRTRATSSRGRCTSRAVCARARAVAATTLACARPTPARCANKQARRCAARSQRGARADSARFARRARLGAARRAAALCAAQAVRRGRAVSGGGCASRPCARERSTSRCAAERFRECRRRRAGAAAAQRLLRVPGLLLPEQARPPAGATPEASGAADARDVRMLAQRRTASGAGPSTRCAPPAQRRSPRLLRQRCSRPKRPTR